MLKLFVRKSIVFIILVLSFAIGKAAQTIDTTKSKPKDSVKVIARLPIVRKLRFDNPYAAPTLFVKDSVNDELYRSLPYFKTTEYPAYLGVIGQAAFSLAYFDNKQLTDNPFLSPFALNFFSSDDKEYYNTRRPYSILKFNGGANVLENFDALLTQNVNKEWNVGFDMHFYGSKGAYNYQKASTHQAKAFTTYFGPRYSIVAQYSANRLFTQENGGIENVQLLRNSQYSPATLDADLTAANSKTRFTQFYVKQEFNLSGRYHKPDSMKVELQEFPICIGHELKADHSFRSFTQTPSYLDKNIYPNKGLDTTKTSDSSLSKVITNFVYLKVSANRNRANSQTIIGGVGVESENYIFSDHLMWNKPNLYNNSFVQGSLWNYAKSHQGFDANTRFYLTGRKQANLLAQARIYLDFHSLDSLRIEAKVEGTVSSPSYFYTSYCSNHFTWNNDNLSKQETVTGTLQLYSLYDKYHLKASATLMNNYVYVDQNLKVDQTNKGIIITAIDGGKKTNWGILYLSTNAVVQSSNTIVQIPLFATTNTIAIKAKLFKKALSMKTGFDVYYWTKYYAPAYMPELGVFYKQFNVKSGDYPFVDAFVQFDFKRMQVFFKYSHASYYVTNSTNFFSVAHYPLDKPSFAYGLSWYFYN